MHYRVEHKFGTVEPHQASYQGLWNSLWKRPCKIGVFPFYESNLDDFEKVFSKLSGLAGKPCDDFDTYASEFFPVAEAVVEDAEAAEAASDSVKATELYLRAAALYRIARFPVIRSKNQHEAWARNKECFYKGAGLLDSPITNIHVPHKYRIAGEGEYLQISLRVPAGASANTPVPYIVDICGLDGYRTERLQASTAYLSRGWGSVAVEIPGTGDSPALREDPTSPDRLWSSLFDWLDEQVPQFDKNQRCVWGLSTGGYYATRVAVTHKERLKGCVAHGGGCHSMFDPEWLEGVNLLEYPFPLMPALAHKFGYETVEAMKLDVQKRFSLLDNGMLDMPCAPLMLANGVNDEVFPIEDYYLQLEHGPAKASRFAGNGVHMGTPEVMKPIFEWLEQLIGKEHYQNGH